MAEYVGSAASISWIHPAGTATLNTNYRRFEVDEPIDTVDSSAGADTHRSVLTTLTTGTIKGEFLDQTGGSVIFNALAPGTSGTLIFGPEGTASGKPRQTITAVVTGRNRPTVYDDIETLAVDWRMQAASSNDTY